MANDYSEFSVLIIDDQQVARQWTRGVLGGFGIELIEDASSASDALKAVTKRGARFDLVLCDLRMPGKDGIETLRMLASMGLECAVAILSVENERVIESAGLLASMRGLNLVGTVAKPLSAEKLESVLQHVIAAKSPRLPPALEITDEELHAAFAAGQLEIHYQPMVHMFSGECIGAEAMVRWMHPRHGLLNADVVVPLVERSPALLAQLTTMTVREALSTCARWHADGHAIGVSVNLSPQAFDQLELPDVVEAVAMEHNVLPGSVTLEVAETTLPNNLAMWVDIAARFRIKGFRLALDNFSGRLSAIDEILQIPFSEVKFDRAIVQGCAQTAAKRAVVEAGLAMARNLKLKTVAIGVSHHPDWELLASLGCDVAQGYFIAHPMPEMGFGIWVTQWMLHKRR
jgi:EAL domain-containing protein (putative c-di-GMP-specific phosphodiesterase class I)/CheY-like chemotaxis protein